MFSIITVSYNSESTISRTISSVLNQSYDDYEYIIVDGASEDRTIEIVKSYEPLFYGKLTWISEPDSGIYNAMNKGIRIAKGEVIGLVNSDDWLESDALKILGDIMQLNKRNDYIIFSGWMNFHYNDGAVQLLKSNEARFQQYIRKYRMGLNHPATFVSKSTYDIIGGFDEELKLYADTDLMIRCYNANINFVFIEAVLSNMSDEGASNRHSKQSLIDRKYILKKHSKNKLQYYFLCFQSIIIDYVKCYLPNKLIRLFRFYNSK